VILLDSHTINLDGVTLPVYKHPLWERFPLYSHQYKALDLKRPFVMNAPTGFGKTYACIIPSLIEKRARTFLIFPSNALVETQYYSVKSRLNEWRSNFNPIKLTGDTLLEYKVKANYKSKGEALYDLVTQQQKNVIFTNVDIMFNIISMRYSAEFAKEIVSTLKSSRIVIDEFHFYKNVTAVLLGALYQRLLEYTKDISFLSATPCRSTLDLLDSINPIYQEFITIGEKVEEHPYSQRKAIYSVSLSITMPSKNMVEEAFTWLVDRYDKGKLGMAILDSVRDSVILYKKLKDAGMNTYLYTGMLKDSIPEDHKKCIIVGTSAIEVGIDKDIDFLFFEANNVVSFLQRFGRVGKHSEGEAKGVVHPEIFRQLRDFPQGKKLQRLEVLDSLVQNEYRFNYSKLFYDSDFNGIIAILVKLYQPDARLTEKEKEVLRNLSARDSISIFVIGKTGKEEKLTYYDVLRVVRDYEVKKIYFDLEAERRIKDLDDLSQQKFEYYSIFYLPIVTEIDNFLEPTQKKLRISFEEPFFFHPSIRIVKMAFEPSIRRRLFRATINNRQIIEEGCITTQDKSDKQKVWVWGYSSKLVEDLSSSTIL